MSVISSNTLLHFTTSRETVGKILISGFRPNYSWEDFRRLDKNQEHTAEKFAIPMVCFCDLPLAQIAKHTEHYGTFGIGMHKDWATKYRISPVIYVYPDAKLWDEINRLYTIWLKYSEEIKEKDLTKTENIDEQLIKKVFTRSEHSENVDQYRYSFYYLMSYVKPYDGTLFKHNGHDIPNVTFYDEREWRFVPDRITPAFVKYESDLNPNEVYYQTLIENIEKHYMLKFDAADVKYIFVSQNQDALWMMDFIENDLKNLRNLSSWEVKTLQQKILITEQVIEDF